MQKLHSVYSFLLAIIILIVGFVLLKVFYNVPYVPILIASVSPFVLLLIIELIKKEPKENQGQQAKLVYNISLGIAALCLFLFIAGHDKYDIYLNKAIIKQGYVREYEMETEDNNGNVGNTTVQHFVVKNDKDEYKHELITYWMILCSWVVPIFLVWYSYRFLKKTEGTPKGNTPYPQYT
ncbi:hypothetical protein [Ferruginibacter albus]|uniref:hypothetical protein n=1 Tax=Ferruginibacter albus TaxID=2875540 RepID=UPI001CC6DA75|nr:hypothetical protein [Ferruginibacter albus]UAY53440.1 hypothetical protein K9M53_07140 [Ferruginibacter albus]